MFPLLHRHAIHRSVLVTLAAWVLALMAGYAYACFPNERAPSHHGQMQAADPDAHEAPCNDAWDGAALTLAKPAGHDTTHMDAVGLRAGDPVLKLALDAAVEETIGIGLRAHGAPGAIRFLRLRL